MVSKIYIAFILSDYQETNLKRFVDHFQIKDQIVLIRNYNYKNYKNKINIPRFPKNVKRKRFYNKYFFLAYSLFILLKNSLYKKKFIFGNPKGKFCIFLRKFINGKNQFYLDDGFETIHYDFNKLKKNSTVFTLYNIRLPSKIINIRFLPKLIKKRKKKCNIVLFIGHGLIEKKILHRDKFKKIMNFISKKNKEFYYYPHIVENDELSLLPQNFKVIKRTNSVEKFILNYKYDFRSIYSFGSSSIIEILNFIKKDNIKIFDIKDFIDNKVESSVYKRGHKINYNYLKKIGIRIIKIKI